LSHVRRRLILIALAALSWRPRYGLAQKPAATIRRIGFLGVSTSAAWTTRIDALRAGLRDLGYVEGKNIEIVFRFAQGQYDRLPELAAELVRLKVDLIVTHSAPGALAAKRATETNPIPVVMTNVSDALWAGIVASLARPGGNITGDTFFVPELAAKRLELLKDALPHLRRVAVLANPNNAGNIPALQAMEVTAKELNLALVRRDVRSPADIDGALTTLAKDNVDALAIVEDIVLIQNHAKIAEAALKQRLPSISFVEYADAGGLFGYGANYLALYRRVSVFVDKIFKGAKPSDIPVERPTTFEFVINMKCAKALNLTIAPPILLRADRQIE
jgi:putative tryptophan/tyrosine transport system substrate-binding protein